MHAEDVESSPVSSSSWTSTSCLVRVAAVPNNTKRFSPREGAVGGWWWQPALLLPTDADGCQDAGGSLELAHRGVRNRAPTDEVAHLDTLSVQRCAHRGLRFELLVLCCSRERRKL